MNTSTRFIEIDYNGNLITSAVTNMDFIGPGVIVSNVGSAVTINIPGSNGTPTGPNNSLQYNSTGTLAGAANLTFNPSTSILSVIGNVHAGYFVGDATRLFNIQGANIVGQIPFAAASNTANFAGTVTTASQPNITTVGTLTSVTTTGLVSATGDITGGNIRTTGLVSATGNVISGNINTPGLIFATGNIFANGNLGTAGLMFAAGNITGGNIRTGGQVSAFGNITSAGYVLGDGSQLTGLPAGYNNANVTALLAGYGSNVISTTGNITSGNLRTAGLISATGDITGGNVNAGASITATSHTGATFSATGNITGGNINTGSQVTATGNVTGGNLRTVGQVSATGNVTGNFFVGNGSLLTGISASGYGNANVVTLLAGYGSNTISTTGNVTASYVFGNGSQLTGLPATYGNANVVTLLAGFGSNTISTTGNVTAANFIGSGAGTPTLSSATNLDLSAAAAVRVIGGGTFRLPNLSAAQIANTIAANGDMLYNTTVNKLQAYENGAWANII
jgi:hypothetical protein